MRRKWAPNTLCKNVCFNDDAISLICSIFFRFGFGFFLFFGFSFCYSPGFKPAKNLILFFSAGSIFFFFKFHIAENSTESRSILNHHHLSNLSRAFIVVGSITFCGIFLAVVILASRMLRCQPPNSREEGHELLTPSLPPRPHVSTPSSSRHNIYLNVPNRGEPGSVRWVARPT